MNWGGFKAFNWVGRYTYTVASVNMIVDNIDQVWMLSGLGQYYLMR